MTASFFVRRPFPAGFAFLFATCLGAQQKPVVTPAPATLSEARLVTLPVVVRDKKGALIQNLTKDDFTLQVDGKPQGIRSFDKDTDLPLSLGLLIDPSLSQRGLIDEERSAGGVFLDQMLTTPKDKAFVAQFSRQTELLQDLTSSRPLLQAALKEIETPSADSSGGAEKGSAGHRQGGSTLYDALFLTADELMKKPAGRKVIVLLSDGVDSGSKETIAHAIESAQRSDTAVYAIYVRGEGSRMTGNNPRSGNYPDDGGYPGGGYPGGGYPGGGYPGGGYPGGGYPGGGYPGGGYPGGGYPGGGNPGGGGGSSRPAGRGHIDGRKVLERMTQETGGRLFEMKKNQELGQIFNQIAEELRARYRLSCNPGQDAAPDGYHHVDLTMRQGLPVQTRDGYYADK